MLVSLMILGQGCATDCAFTPDWVDWEGVDDEGFSIRCECTSESGATCYWQLGREPGACGGWIENSEVDLANGAIVIENGEEQYELSLGQADDLREACGG